MSSHFSVGCKVVAVGFIRLEGRTRFMVLDPYTMCLESWYDLWHCTTWFFMVNVGSCRVEMRLWVLVVCLELGEPYLCIHFNSEPHLCSMRIMGRSYVEETLLLKNNNKWKVYTRKSHLVSGLGSSIIDKYLFHCFLNHCSSSEWRTLIACFLIIFLVCDDMINMPRIRATHTIARR